MTEETLMALIEKEVGAAKRKLKTVEQHFENIHKMLKDARE